MTTLKLQIGSHEHVLRRAAAARLVEEIDAYDSKSIYTVELGPSTLRPSKITTPQFRLWFKSKGYRINQDRLPILRDAAQRVVNGQNAVFVVA
jgi:hypothetical protein